MPRIPVAIFQPQPTGQIGSPVNPHMFDSEYAAVERLGAAVGQLGDVAADFALRTQAAENYRKETELETALHAARGDFINSLKDQPDETQWAANWQRRLDATVSAAMPKRIAPALQPKITAMVDRFRQDTRIEVDHLALARGIDRAKTAGMTRLQLALNQGDRTGYEKTLGDLVTHSLMTPEDADAMRRAADQKFDHSAAVRAMQEDPRSTEELLGDKTDGGRWRNFTALTDEQRMSLRLEARRTVHQQQSDQAEALRGNFDAALEQGEAAGRPADVPSMIEQVNTAEKAGAISAAGASQLRLHLKRERATQMTDKADSLIARAITYDPGADRDGGEAADIRSQAAGLPGAKMKQVLSALKGQIEAHNKTERPVVAERRRIDQQDRESGVFLPHADLPASGHLWWSKPADTGAVDFRVADVRKMTDAEVTKFFGPKADKQKIIDAEEMNWAHYLTQMRAFEEANPNATDEQLQRESMRLKSGHVVAQVSAALSVPPPQRVAQAPQFVEGAEYRDAKGNRAVYLGGDPSKPEAWRELK